MKIDHKDSYQDFGEQFSKDLDIGNYWGSLEMLKDIVCPFNLNVIKDKIIAEVGVGSGRILNNLTKFKPKKIYAVEPSKAIKIAKENNIKNKHKIEYLNIKAEDMALKQKADYIFSLGVIHHIPKYDVACKQIYNSLSANGTFIIWVYGFEGNELYIKIFNNVRRISRLLPDKILRMFCYLLNFMCSVYILLCSFLNLPLKKYMLNVFKKCSFEKRNYIIFDQLNPSFSKYFRKEEVNQTLKKAGFKKINLYHRYSYSWLAIAKK